MHRYIYISLLVTCSALANNDQSDGSLNTYNGEGSVVSSNNTTKDDSVSNTYNGAGSSSEMPVGSAISPSYMSTGVDTLLEGLRWLITNCRGRLLKRRV